jgi:outer membrane lipoprotein-sorting protein
MLLVSACGGGGGSTTTTSSTAVTGTTPTSTSSTQTTTSTTTTTTAAGNSVSGILGKLGNVDTITYDLTMTVPGQAAITMTIYQKKNKMREEMTVGGIAAAVIIDGDAQTMYTYMPSLNMATKMTYDSSAIIPGAWETDDTAMDYNPNIVGKESIDGKSCTVIAWEIPGSGSAKEWIWTEKGFPLKMEMTTSAGKTTMEYRNVDFSDIPDSTFELPADAQIVSQ